MRYCQTCKVEYRVDEIYYCLNDGTRLVDRDTQETIVIPENPPAFDALKVTSALTKLRYTSAVDEQLVSLYIFEDFYELALDARFTRLVDYVFNEDPEKCLQFIRRLAKRAELCDAKQRANPDAATIWESLDGNNVLYTCEFLENRGLL